jgi:hypothetical protein
MQFTADGQVNQAYQPYIDQSETNRAQVLWNPYAPYYTGLYEGARPKAVTMPEHIRQVQASYKQTGRYAEPIRTITSGGQYYSGERDAQGQYVDQSHLPKFNPRVPKYRNEMSQPFGYYPRSY